MSTPVPPRRKWLQLHPSTAVVLMFATGGIIWANSIERISWVSYHENSIYDFNRTQYEISGKLADHLMNGDDRWRYYLVDPIFKVRKYGWPFPVYEWQIRLTPKDFPNEGVAPQPVINWYRVAIFLDCAMTFVLLATVWFLCEWLIRRRAASSFRVDF